MTAKEGSMDPQNPPNVTAKDYYGFRKSKPSGKKRKRGRSADKNNLMDLESIASESGNEHFDNERSESIDSPSTQSPVLDDKTIQSAIYSSYTNQSQFFFKSKWYRYGVIYASSFGFEIIFLLPQMCIKYGLPSFMLLYTFFLTFLAIPHIYLSLALGQFSSLPPIQLFSRMTPLVKGMGYLLTVVRVVLIFMTYDDMIGADIINMVTIMFGQNSESYRDCLADHTFITCYDKHLNCAADVNITSMSVQYLGQCHPMLIFGHNSESPMKLNNSYTFDQYVLAQTSTHTALRLPPLEKFLKDELESKPSLNIMATSLISMALLLVFARYGLNLFSGLCFYVSTYIFIALLFMTSLNIYSGMHKKARFYVDFNSTAFTDLRFYVETFIIVMQSTGLTDGTLLLIGSSTQFYNDLHADLIFIWISNVLNVAVVFMAMVPTFSHFIHQTYPESTFFETVRNMTDIVPSSISPFSFHLQFVGMYSETIYRRIFALFFYLAMICLQICPQTLTAELVMQTMTHVSKSIALKNPLPTRVQVYSVFVLCQFTVVLGGQYFEFEHSATNHLSSITQLMLMPGILLLQSIFFVYPYSAKRIGINIYTMLAKQREKKRYTRFLFPPPTSKIWAWTWKFLIPIWSLIMFAFCQLVILEDRNITNTTMDRIMLYTSHCLGLVNVLFIVPLIGFHQIKKAKMLGKNVQVLYEPDPRYGPRKLQDRYKAEFDERAARVRN